MIVSYSFENYKAFANGKIELKPITILLGSNSSGKTSIAQILLLMQQTLKAANQKYKAALKLHGKYVSMGGIENLYKDKNTENLLSFSFEYDSQQLSRLIREGLEQSFLEYTYMAYSFLLSFPKVKKGLRLLISRRVKDSFVNFPPDLNNPNDVKNFTRALDKIREIVKDKEFKERFSFYADQRDVSIPSSKDMSCSIELLKKIKNIKSNSFKLEYILFYDVDKTQLNINKIILKNKDSIILEITFDRLKNKVSEINSDFVDKSFLNNYNPSIQKLIESEQSIFYLFSDKKRFGYINSFAELIRKIMFTATKELRENFNDSRLYHISPLRAEPRRFYFLDKANIDTMTGDNIVEVLKEDEELLEKVNNWLKIFNVEISITEFKEIIHRLSVTQEGLNIELDITDVGFGISQILPVIVQGFLSKQNSLTIIEQPEIHLHPKMQAELADLFIDITMGEKKKRDHNKHLLIETHSEYLLKRLRRRISEGVIESHNVAIYFIHSRTEKDEAKLEKIQIHKNGSFKWPKNFYIDDLEDTYGFLINQ